MSDAEYFLSIAFFAPFAVHNCRVGYTPTDHVAMTEMCVFSQFVDLTVGWGYTPIDNVATAEMLVFLHNLPTTAKGFSLGRSCHKKSI